MIQVEIENVSSAQRLPTNEQLQRWAEAATQREGAEAYIRIVDESEIAELNQTYRHKPGPTNVLSFPIEVPAGVPNDHLGDVVICAQVVEREAAEQGKSLESHWAHMVVHGFLHLQGYDHIEDGAAEIMESQEIAILARLGFSNPYEAAGTL